jgi:hypothetical protein
MRDQGGCIALSSAGTMRSGRMLTKPVLERGNGLR